MKYDGYSAPINSGIQPTHTLGPIDVDDDLRHRAALTVTGRIAKADKPTPAEVAAASELLDVLGLRDSPTA